VAPPVRSAAAAEIPEEEMTPRVREAIAALAQETGRLRRELEQTRAQLAEMERRADEDALLPILNRRAFVREIERSIGLAARYGTPSSLIYFDLDDFKRVNDEHGHDAGDRVLQHICDLVLKQIRRTDVFARIGGDEFGIILSHVRAHQAIRNGARLAQGVRDRPAVIDGHQVLLSLCYGVYELRADDVAENALKEADLAMYERKRSRA
jgi:diguanylate cyclase (GGDEF)-like protein